MANYPGATSFPSLRELQTEFSDQIESGQFEEFTTKFCKKAKITIDDLVRISIDYLKKSKHKGVADLVDFMLYINSYYNLNYNRESVPLYKAVKGLPFHSYRSIGYTFYRRRRDSERGVFVFLM